MKVVEGLEIKSISELENMADALELSPLDYVKVKKVKAINLNKVKRWIFVYLTVMLFARVPIWIIDSNFHYLYYEILGYSFGLWVMLLSFMTGVYGEHFLEFDGDSYNKKAKEFIEILEKEKAKREKAKLESKSG